MSLRDHGHVWVSILAMSCTTPILREPLLNADHSARMLISVAPAGLEQMFFDVGIALPEASTTAPAPTEDDVKKLLAAASGYGIDIPPPDH